MQKLNQKNTKILFVDTSLTGHHLVYVDNLIQAIGKEQSVVLMPRCDYKFSCKHILLNHYEDERRSVFTYLKMLYEIYSVATKEKVSIIHFLTGDIFYKYLGIGLRIFRRWKTVCTIHWVREGRLQSLSLRRICKAFSINVVHSSYLKNEIRSLGVENVYHIEYPQFNKVSAETNKSRDYFNLAHDVPVLACIGGTRYDKGLDILVNALKNVSEEYQLLIAGQPSHFKESDIITLTEEIADKTHLCLRFLSDEELAAAISASDFIVLPYRKTFNGASGPLGEGVSFGKCIIGSDHGNLGYTINTYHLGYTFMSENVEALSNVITQALSVPFAEDEQYKKYQKLLNPNHFRLEYKKIYEQLTER